MRRDGWKMRWMLHQIGISDDGQLSRVSQALIRRYKVLHPDYELVVMLLPKHDRQARTEILRAVEDNMGIYEK